MKKKLIASVTCLCLLLVMLMSSTLAWFTDQTNVQKSTMTVGEINIEQYVTKDNKNIMPSDPYQHTVTVENIGTEPAFVRTLFAFEDGAYTDLKGKTQNILAQIDLNEGNQIVIPGVTTEGEKIQFVIVKNGEITLYTVGYYVDPYVMEVGDKVTPMTSFTLNEETDKNWYAAVEGEYDILVLSQACQVVGLDQLGAAGALIRTFGEINGKNAAEWFGGIQLPTAKVTDLGARKEFATVNGWNNGPATEFKLPFVLQFEPTETLDQANASPFKYWHADYVVKADKDVKANSIALAGYYKAFCDDINDGNWVALTADDVIPAGTEIRLVDVMSGGDGTGNGSIKVTYKDICQWGNDGTGFLCSAADLTGANAGTTLTVELRVYANESDPTQSSYNGGTETGEYFVVGTYTYKFGEVTLVENAKELQNALTAGKNVELLNDITLNTAPIQISKDVVIDLNGHDLTAESGSRPFQSYDADITINASGSDVELDQYGLVDIKEGDVKISIIGGTFTGELNNGAVIKGRANTKAEIYLKDVNMTFTDTSAKGSYVFNPDKGASATTVIEGGVYNIDCGFIGNVTMKNATVNAKGFVFNGGGSIENCTITTDGSSKAPADAAPFCCVAASNDRTVTVKNSTLTATNCNAIEVYPTGGEVIVTGSTVTGACYKHPLYDANDKCSITIDGVEQSNP